MSAPDYSSIFSNSKFNAFTPVAFGEKTGNLSKAGGGMAFDPVTLGLGAASIGASMFGASQARQAQASIANAQMAAAADQLKWQTMLARDTAKGQMGSEIGSRVFQSTVAPDLEFGRQREAAMFAAGPLGERQLGLDVERARRQFGLEGSAEVREAKQRANRDALKQSLAEREATMAGMFGRIAPREVGTFFV
jgi:hypothetical protein